MRAFHLLALLLALCFPLFLAACGGDDDSEDSGDSPSTEDAEATQEDSGDEGDDGDDGGDDGDDGDGDGGGGGGDAGIPEIKDGNYGSGTVHIEISGDNDETLDVDGGGIAVAGAALLTYGSQDATVIISFTNDDETSEGGISVTTTDVSTAGAWGEECDVNVEQSDSGISGEFTCEDIEALETGSLDTLQVTIRGTFSVSE